MGNENWKKGESSGTFPGLSSASSKQFKDYLSEDLHLENHVSSAVMGTFSTNLPNNFGF